VLRPVDINATEPVLKNLYQKEKWPGSKSRLITLYKASILLVVATLVPFFILESRLVKEFAKQIYMKTGIQ
jgi:hypothetical protein